MPDEAREVIFPQGVPLIGAAAGEGGERPAPRPPAPPTSATEPVATPAEGNLTSEVGELSAQADRAPAPDDAPDLLVP